jgi:peptidoglycan/LPS O-acetylase OafA/YrhL
MTKDSPKRANLLATGWYDLTHRPAAQEPALDALRSFAVLAVICSHYALPEWPKAGGLPLGVVRFPLFYFGWTGVDLFFVLSGLLIGRQVWREIQKTGSVNVGKFLIRRGFRIWPLYYVALIYLSIVERTSWPDWTFLSNYFQTGYPRGWSLSTEEQFYILVPLLLMLTTRLFSLRHQLWPLLALLAAVPFMRVFTHNHLLALGYSGETLSAKMQYPIHVHSEPLLIGLIIALFSVVRPAWFTKQPRGRVAWHALGILVAATAVGLALDRYDKDIFAFLALGLIFGAAVYFAMVDRSVLTKPLHAWVFYPIARLSFGMYLNHFLVVPESTAWVLRLGAGLPTMVVFWLGLLFGAMISISVALLTFLLVEHPFLTLRARVLTGRVRSNTMPLTTPASR